MNNLQTNTHDALRQGDLSPDEWTLLLDAMISYRYEGGQFDRSCPRFFLTVQVEDAIELERLDTKWGVERDTLLAKIRAASPEAALAIIEAVIDWREQNHNNGRFMPAPPPRVRRLLQA